MVTKRKRSVFWRQGAHTLNRDVELSPPSSYHGPHNTYTDSGHLNTVLNGRRFWNIWAYLMHIHELFTLSLAPEFVNSYQSELCQLGSWKHPLPFFTIGFAGFLTFCNGNHHCRRSNRESIERLGWYTIHFPDVLGYWHPKYNTHAMCLPVKNIPYLCIFVICRWYTFFNGNDSYPYPYLGLPLPPPRPSILAPKS